MYNIILLFICFRCSSTLNCGSCHGVDEIECERTQKMKECGQFGSCMTLSYIRSEDNASTVYPIYKKGCSWDMRNCLRHCLQLERFLHVRDCQVSCCNTDFCNRISPTEDEYVLVKVRIKRNSSAYPSRCAFTHYIYYLVILITLMAIGAHF